MNSNRSSSTPRPKSQLQRLVDELEPDTAFDAADLGTAFGMECMLAEQEAADEFLPSEMLDD
jgi:hypothetical protein